MRGDSRQRHPIPPTRWPTRAEAEASRLYSPVVLGPLTLRARTWIPAMVPWRATDEGEVTPEVLEWYGRFAEGRPGAIVVEATGIRDVPSGPLLRIGHDRYIPGLARLVDEVRRRSGGHTQLLIQLIDFLSVRRRPEPERYFGRFLAVGPEHHARLAEATGEAHWAHATEAELRAVLAARPELWRAVLSARELEALEYGQRERVTDVHLSHVRELPAVLPGLFAAAAHRAAAAGFDGVELHYAHAYTMASFLSRTNDRADGYGGSLEGRLRLPLEVIAAVAQALPTSVALGCRFLGDEVIAGGSREAEATAYGVAFARAGLHFLSLSKGGKFEDAKQPKVGHAAYPYTGESGHECMPTVWSDARGPFGRNLHLAHAVRSAVRAAGLETPVIAAGGITTFELAEAALTRGACDVVASARQALADPDWLEKVRLGHGEAVRRCALTNYCEGLDQQHKQVTCRLWDRLDVPGAEGRTRSHDGKRWLVAPPWRAPEG